MGASVETRGSWSLDESIATRWDAEGLDTVFRNEWPANQRLLTKYQPLNDQMARPVPPGPYCVYDKTAPTIVGHMTGAEHGGRENQLQTFIVQFSIHAKSTATESGKAICIRLAKKVAAAFDPSTAPWAMTDDKFVRVIREPDFHAREGDDEWVWVVQYNVMIDAQYHHWV